MRNLSILTIQWLLTTRIIWIPIGSICILEIHGSFFKVFSIPSISIKMSKTYVQNILFIKDNDHFIFTAKHHQVAVETWVWSVVPPAATRRRQLPGFNQWGWTRELLPPQTLSTIGRSTPENTRMSRCSRSDSAVCKPACFSGYSDPQSFAQHIWARGSNRVAPGFSKLNFRPI